jgi:hypothetical protein
VGLSKVIMKISKMFKHHGVFYFLLLALSIWISGCSEPKPKPNPLVGWSRSQRQNPKYHSQVIISDYNSYIQSLPENVRSQVDETAIVFLENQSGQHAVKIEIPINGARYEHLLIYDQNNVRTNTVVFVSGRYSSQSGSIYCVAAL